MKVVLDIGNVLVNVSIDGFVKKISELIPEENDPLLFLETIQGMHDIGLLTMRQAFRDRYELSHSSKVSLEDLLLLWNQVVTRNDFMINFMKDLHFQGVRFGLVSNMGFEHHQYLQEICPEIFELSEIHHLSYQVGARKPSKLYFQSFLQDHPSWIGCVYLDDRMDNILAGKSYGFRTVPFNLEDFSSIKDLKSSTDSIKKLILKHRVNEDLK
jgi:FMN phosphatase YigB (HAD superfamily)